mmetsp:Transcript_30435/g.45907  ORF Transcript_30435/g.45907 Transcript_30435/m.45907 type:complete len:197 (+) Transcript_30435:76-666(+)|eukprot:CAMPEP_0206471492 /NCGR_PEP_ID=MMETSP0324_2-20121206/31598_1 /ASSEMBLY_ACC=CAM_ASM_000836 /TAXON_ID=2866 /ORGANISM="Crypthecodinium cohnii, Strain Seligo" /LENGTH=196 /DNA_ID=CAMNT_0053945833 /DNA_START=197 /DNA_END=787 /DNA_ORIENTATION=+
MQQQQPAVGYQRPSPKVELYGGAIVAELPESFADASEFRQVPDHQEVWVDTASDASFIVEILERKADVQDVDAVRYFLTDLAAANQAKDPQILASRAGTLGQDLPHFSQGEVIALVGVGEQQVSKFGESCANTVQVHICVLRLPAQETDILVMLNSPVSIDAQSSSGSVPTLDNAEGVFAKILQSLAIQDWELFNA